MTGPIGSLGNSLKIWYYLVFGFVTAAAEATIGAGGGIIIPPTGLIPAIGAMELIGFA